MKNFKTLLSTLLLSYLAFSCTEEDFEKNRQVENLIKNTNNYEIIEFNYKGIKYSSAYYYIGDSVVILDEETRNVHNIITKSDNSFILIDDDNITTYYDNEAEYFEDKSKIQIRSTDLRPYTSVKIELFQHDPTYFLPHSPKLTINIKYFFSSNLNGDEIKREKENKAYTDLGKYGLNNNLTFVKIYACVGNMTYYKSYELHTKVTLYDLDNFRLPSNPLHGRDFYELTAGVDWRTSGEYIYATGDMSNLTQKEEYSRSSSYNLNKVFNDKASSLKITSTIKSTMLIPNKTDGGRTSGTTDSGRTI